MNKPSGERRQITALFADLVDSVELSRRLDPEDMMTITATYFSVCNDIISRHGGFITQYMGDGVLGFFGYPCAGEDNAANAVRAGLELRDAVGSLDLPGGIALQLRIGIATGLVVVSEINRNGAPAVDIVGEAPNLAARLQSIARPDTVIVAEATERLSRGLFSYRNARRVTLKGFSAPVAAIEAVEAIAADNRFHARLRGELTPLVGRDREMAAMLDCWAAARGGAGGAVLLLGEAGIGKSRLVEELRQRAADGAHQQVTWYCSPTRTDSALDPIVVQLAHAAGFERRDTADAKHAKLAHWLAQYGAADPQGRAVLADLLGLPNDPATPIEAMTPEKRKEATLEALIGLLDRRAGQQPVLIVLEDAHWSDPTTLNLLDRIIRLSAERPWMTLVTARRDLARAWPSMAPIRQIRLERLDRSAAERICNFIGGSVPLPRTAVREIIARCDGIPLFVEEMTRSVIDAVAAAPDAAPHAEKALAIPVSVQDSLVARLDRLGPARQLANLAAAIGRSFSYELLAALADQPDLQLLAGLRDLTRSGLIESSGSPPTSRYYFKHALIRDAAYQSLLKRERQILHGRIASVLREGRSIIQDSEPELLAYHLTESGAGAEAIALWAEAGQRAAARAAHVEAVRHLQKALDLLRQQPADGQRSQLELQVLIGFAFSCAASQGYAAPEVGKALAEAQAICHTLGGVELFPVLRGLGNFLVVAGDLDGAEEIGRRCADIAEQTSAAEHRIGSQLALGYVRFAKGRLPEARSRLEMAVRLYQENDGVQLPRVNTNDPLVGALSVLLQVQNAMGDELAAARIAEQLENHARSLGRPFELALALTWLTPYKMFKGNFAQALAYVEEALEICTAHGYYHYGLVNTMARAYALGYQGHVDLAIEIARQALPALKQFGSLHFSCVFLSEFAGLQALAGDFSGALQSIDEAIAAALRYGDAYFLSPLQCRRAEILAAILGPAAPEVTAALQRAISIAEDQGAAGFAREAAAMRQRHSCSTSNRARRADARHGGIGYANARPG